MITLVALTAFLAVIEASVALAAMGQEKAPTPTSGSLLRLTVDSGAPERSESDRRVRLAGTLVRTTSDSLILTDVSGGFRGISFGDIRKLEERRPRTRGEGATRGLKWGALLGGAAGGVLGAISWASCDPDQAIVWCPGPLGGAAILGLFGGGIGAGVGAVVGAVNPGDRWVEIPGPRTDVTLSLAGEGRAGIATTWRF